ncbi:MAG: carbon storage regulator [Pirellulaceae bacterium]|nr:carbon storage regulator [Pirellulaceae bacterium]
MLVLSRKKNESLVIRDDLVVTVIDVRGDKVRLGIEAPEETSLHAASRQGGHARQETSCDASPASWRQIRCPAL